jgi:signal transduction histidine kinase
MSSIEDSQFSAAASALLLATLRYCGPENHTEAIAQWSDQFAEPLGFYTLLSDRSVCQAIVNHLKNFLLHIESQGETPSRSELRAAILQSILSVQHATRISDAIAEQSKKQIYHFAYGLTHEINNPLANIAARAQQLLRSGVAEEHRKSVATIVDQAMRAYEMLAEMMHVVKPPPLETQSVELSQIWARAIDSVRSRAEQSGIELQAPEFKKPIYAVGHPAELEDVFRILLANSCDACRPGDEICAVVETLNYGDPDAIGLGLGKTQIRIVVRDTGPGMSQESVANAFFLYYSGRESGRGLGISLAKAKRIVEACGGQIWLQSHPKSGTTVEIRLQASGPAIESKQKIRRR